MTRSGGKRKAMPIMRRTDKTARTPSATFEKCYDKKGTLRRLSRHCAEVRWRSEKRDAQVWRLVQKTHRQHRKNKRVIGDSGCAVEDKCFTCCVPLSPAQAKNKRSSTLSLENRRPEQAKKKR